MKISDEQLARVREQGYVIVEGFLSPAELAPRGRRVEARWPGIDLRSYREASRGCA